MKKIIINSNQAKLLKSLNEDINNTFSSAFKKTPSKSFKPNMNDNKGKKFNPLAENEMEKDNKFGKNMIDLLKKIIKDGSEFELPKFFEKYNIDKDILLKLLKSNHIINDKLQVYKNNLVDNVKNLCNDLNTNHVKKNETDLVQAVTEDNNDPSIGGEKTHSTTPTDPKYKPLNVIHFNREICILKDDKDKLFVYYYFDINKDDFKPYASIDYKYIGKDFDGEPEYEFDKDWEVDKDVLTRYVNDNLGELSKGKGLKSYESGKDLVLIDDALKTELIGLYDKDKKLVEVLGGISESTTAASSGSFSTPLSSDNVIKKDIVDEDNINNNREKIYINGFEWWLDKTINPPKVFHSNVSKEEGISIYSNHFTNDERRQVLDFIKYGRKGESSKFIDETTDSSSSGQYSQPAFLAKDPNNSRFSKKPMYPNGTIVNKKIKVSESFIYNQISKKLNKSIDDVKKIVYEQKIPLNKLPKLLKLVENGNELKTQTTYKDGEMVGFDNCTKLNNNKEAQQGRCSVGAVDNVVKHNKTKDSLMETSLDSVKMLNTMEKVIAELGSRGNTKGSVVDFVFKNKNRIGNGKEGSELWNNKVADIIGYYLLDGEEFQKKYNILKHKYGKKSSNSSLNEDNDKVKTSLKNQILTAFPNMNDEDFDRHETDLYVRYSPEVDNWLKQNYEFYKNITTFKSNVDNQRWFDIPFAAWDEKYGKKSSDIGIEGEKHPNLTPQQKEHLKRINEMPLQAIINGLNKMKVDPETISPQFIESNWWGKLTYDWENKRWLAVSDSEAQGGLALNAIDSTEHLSENNLNTNKIFDITNVKENVEKIKSSIKAPHVGVQYSTLGGDVNVSILIVVSLDQKETWSNGYIENTRYFRLHLDNDGTLEMFTVSKLPLKLRKSKNKSIDEVINRINKYINTINSQNNSNLSK